MSRILIVDDEESIRDALRQVFEYEEHEVGTAADGPEALALFESFTPHVTFLDVKMSGLDGLEVLTRIRKLDPSAYVVMISGHGTIDSQRLEQVIKNYREGTATGAEWTGGQTSSGSSTTSTQ
mgnify:CR=1 FL=1